MLFLDYLRTKIPLTMDLCPYLNREFILFSFRQRSVDLAGDKILVDTGAKFCILDSQTIANLANVNLQSLEKYLYHISQLSSPSQSSHIMPNFGLPFSRPQYLRGFGGIGRWTISISQVQIILKRKFSFPCTFHTTYNINPILGMPFLENVKIVLDRKKSRSLILF